MPGIGKSFVWICYDHDDGDNRDDSPFLNTAQITHEMFYYPKRSGINI
jgi:hypothetical protein